MHTRLKLKVESKYCNLFTRVNHCERTSRTKYNRDDRYPVRFRRIIDSSVLAGAVAGEAGEEKKLKCAHEIHWITMIQMKE